MRGESHQGSASFPVSSHVFESFVPPAPGAADPESKLRKCVARIVLREAKALEELYDATVHRLYSVAFRILKNEEAAEEAVSDAYYQAWREADRYDPSRACVLTWLLVICRSRALDALRRRDEAMVHPDPYALADSAQAHPG